MDYTCRRRLAWPLGLPRTKDGDRKGSSVFRSGGRAITVPAAERRLADVLDAFTPAGKNWRTSAVEIAADWEVGKLGGFLADGGKGRSGDPGAVLSFVLDRKPLTLPCDRYDSVAGNLAAIAAHLEAVRGIERWGVATVEQMLSSHAVLPRPKGARPKRAWWEVLEVRPSATEAQVEAAYRRLAKIHHPDVGDSPDDAAMVEINLARDEWKASR